MITFKIVRETLACTIWTNFVFVLPGVIFQFVAQGPWPYAGPPICIWRCEHIALPEAAPSVAEFVLDILMCLLIMDMLCAAPARHPVPTHPQLWPRPPAEHRGRGTRCRGARLRLGHPREPASALGTLEGRCGIDHVAAATTNGTRCTTASSGATAAYSARLGLHPRLAAGASIPCPPSPPRAPSDCRAERLLFFADKHVHGMHHTYHSPSSTVTQYLHPLEVSLHANILETLLS